MVSQSHIVCCHLWGIVVLNISNLPTWLPFVFCHQREKYICAFLVCPQDKSRHHISGASTLPCFLALCFRLLWLPREGVLFLSPSSQFSWHLIQYSKNLLLGKHTQYVLALCRHSSPRQTAWVLTLTTCRPIGLLCLASFHSKVCLVPARCRPNRRHICQPLTVSLLACRR